MMVRKALHMREEKVWLRLGLNYCPLPSLICCCTLQQQLYMCPATTMCPAILQIYIYNNYRMETQTVAILCDGH